MKYEYVILGDMVTFQKGFIFKSKDFTNYGIPVVKVSNFIGDTVDMSSCEMLPNSFYETNKKYSLEEDEILIATVGSWPTNPNSVVGRVVRVPKLKKVALLNQNIVKITSNSDLLSNDFLYYLLKSKTFKDYLVSTAQGSANQASITLESIRKFNFELPSIDSQYKIAHFLKMIDKKINTNKQIINSLELLSQTLFKHWFIDFEFPNEQGQPYKSSGGEMVESELGEIPKNWTVITIKDVCDANKGSLSKKDNWPYINYLDTSNITNNSLENIQFIDATKDKIPSRAKRKIQPNDIVYSTVRPNQHHYGIIKEPTENMIASTGFTVLRSKGVYPNDLIYLWITQKEVIDNLQAIAEQSTSAYPSIKADNILSMKILLPPKKELAVLAGIIEVQNKVIWNKQQENKKLSELRDILLPKLLSGEIKIPDEVVVD